LDLDEEVKAGSRVVLTVKSSHVAVAKSRESCLGGFNLLNATITEVDNGKLLSVLKCSHSSGVLESIMIVDFALEMALCVGDNVTLMIAPSALSILEVL